MTKGHSLYLINPLKQETILVKRGAKNFDLKDCFSWKLEIGDQIIWIAASTIEEVKKRELERAENDAQILFDMLQRLFTVETAFVTYEESDKKELLGYNNDNNDIEDPKKNQNVRQPLNSKSAAKKSKNEYDTESNGQSVQEKPINSNLILQTPQLWQQKIFPDLTKGRMEKGLKMAIDNAFGYFATVWAFGLLGNKRATVIHKDRHTILTPFFIATTLPKYNTELGPFSPKCSRTNFPIDPSKQIFKNRPSGIDCFGVYGRITTQGQLLIKNPPVNEAVFIVRDEKQIIFVDDEEIPAAKVRNKSYPNINWRIGTCLFGFPCPRTKWDWKI